MNKRKIFCLVLLISVLATIFSGCFNFDMDNEYSEHNSSEQSSVSKTESETDVSSEYDENFDYLTLINDYDYENKKFTIITPQTQIYTADAESGTLNKAIYERNERVENKLHVKVKTQYATTETIKAKVTEAALSGIPYGNVISAPAYVVSEMANKGELLNIYSLPGIDNDAVYIKDALTMSGVINNTLYMMINEVSISSKDGWAVFYNPKLADTNELKTYISSGEWTWDKMLEVSKIIAKDTLNKRSPDRSRDVFGYTTLVEEKELVNAIWCTSGVKYFGDTVGKMLELPTDTATGKAVAKTAKSITESKIFLDGGGEACEKAFLDGRIGFFIYRIEYIAVLEEKGIDYGVLPLPKLNKETENYYSVIDNATLAIAVPKIQEDSMFTGVVLNALCAASYGKLNTALNMSYLYHYIDDNEDAVKIKNILGNACFDNAVMYSVGMPDIAAVTIDSITNAIEGNSAVFTYLESTKNTFAAFSKKTSK